MVCSIHMKNKRKKLIVITSIGVGGLVVIGVLLYMAVTLANVRRMTEELSEYGFVGKGTQVSPYLISSIKDLEHFRDLVNAGESFSYRYFRQTESLDLISIDNWTPIGVFGSGNYFCGNYDGGGHFLNNLHCIGTAQGGLSNVELFGYLDGEVRNLGIESGEIEGSCVGSIASHGSVNAVIINCYNKATIMGERAGGIVDNFSGSVLFCFNMGRVIGNYSTAGISSYNCGEISYCYSTTTNNLTIPATFSGRINHSMNLTKEDMDQDFIKYFYKAMSKWNSLSVDKEGLAKIAIENGDVHFSQNSNGYPSGSNGLNALIALLCVMLLILIFSDYIINVRRRYISVSEEKK